MDKILSLLKKNTPDSKQPIEKLRANFETFYSQFQSRKDLHPEPLKIGHVQGYWITTSPDFENRVILFFHGGGFSQGSVMSHLDLCGRLSSACHAKVLGINYRKTSEHAFPDQLEDCLTAYAYLLQQNYQPSQIFLAGISAGGTLVLSTLLALKSNESPMPRGGICLSPLVDFTLSGESIHTNKDKDWIVKERLQAICSMYLGETSPKNPFASPLYADLKGFPPLLLQVGSSELLLDDSRRFAEKAQQDGVKAKLEVWDEMIHAWPIFAKEIPEGARAIESVGKFVEDVVKNNV